MAAIGGAYAGGDMGGAAPDAQAVAGPEVAETEGGVSWPCTFDAKRCDRRRAQEAREA